MITNQSVLGNSGTHVVNTRTVAHSSTNPASSSLCTSTQTAEWENSTVPIPINPFQEEAGPTFEAVGTPVDIFSRLFPDTLISHIVVEMNRYAEQEMGSEAYAHWEPTEIPELKAFFGFAILMGLVHMPEVKYYWRVDQYFHYEPIASRISQNRFRSRSRYLHFKDNSKAPARGQSMHDRHGKVRPIIEQIGSALASSYIPGRDIVVDEAMIPFKGRSSLKQYMPMKPVKRGLKVWCLAESKTSYVHKFEVYTGKNDMGHVPEEKALGAQVVLSLTSHLQGKKLSLIL